MAHDLAITPHGHLLLVESPAGAADAGLSNRCIAAFAESGPHGLLHLATHELTARLPGSLDFVRTFARAFLTRLCQAQVAEGMKELPPTPPLAPAEWTAWILQAPPMMGLEYLREEVLAEWWSQLDELVRTEIKAHPGGAQEYLSAKNPSWRFVGRVTFHLAENKRDLDNPFAFVATYASHLSDKGKAQHQVLGQSLQQYAGEKNREALLRLLVPIQQAAERSSLVKELVDSGDVYHPLSWTPQDAYRFLRDIPIFEDSGLLVRVPDWWKPKQPPRPVVNVRVDSKTKSSLTVDALLEFSVDVSFDGERLTEAELRELLAETGGLVQLKGKWVEVDRDKLSEALKHWKKVQKEAREGGLSFYQGMRLLAGASLDGDAAGEVNEATRAWTGLSAGPVLEATLRRLRSPEAQAAEIPSQLQAKLRPYQIVGWKWLQFLAKLGLGACLADDMGLGKTVQVISLLLALQEEKDTPDSKQPPCLLVVPASLIANWQAEIQRFAPSLKHQTAHPSENPAELPADVVDASDLVITTYGVLTRQDWLRKRSWNLVILDEAQAIKNSGTRQTKAAKELQAHGRIAMTGTPIENRLSDLWSLFDFLNPGLLGSAKSFASFVKKLDSSGGPSYGPLRSLVQPFILRRLKTDKNVIADLPDKTEVKVYCGLSKHQVAHYEQAVRDLEEKLEDSDGIQRRGIVLAQLMRLKQICNHPSQMLGAGDYDPKQSGKFQRLAELCEELAQRQEKALIFTQFREIAEPLARFLEGVFGRPGLILDGSTAVARRRELVDRFQRDEGPPFFVLSLKAGGTGLNLTAASQVIHFDRWWNPAVENQATDRAFRIGQKKNVMVHKFVCRGTVEERIDAMIAQKSSIAKEVVEGGAERLLTEMANDELLNFVALDIRKAMDA